jgi:hypothetical protein
MGAMLVLVIHGLAISLADPMVITTRLRGSKAGGLRGGDEITAVNGDHSIQK